MDSVTTVNAKSPIRWDEVLEAITAHREALKQLGVKSLILFGSVARNEAKSDSDIDFLVEFEEPGGLFQLLELKHYLEDIFTRSVDLGTLEALREHLREPVLKEAIRAL